MKPLIAIDWDDTLVKNAWPEHGEFFPGAVEAVKDMLTYARVTIFTLRVHPIEVDGFTERHPSAIRKQHDIIRAKLDGVGLSEVSIYMEPGKPPAELFIDDRAMFFPGRNNSWKLIQMKVRAKLGQYVDIWEEDDV